MLTIQLSPEELTKESRELARHGVPVVLSLSTYDIPRSLTVDRDPSTGRWLIRFDYPDQEPHIDHSVDDELTVQLGRHSGKVLGFTVSAQITKPREITVRIVQGVDSELARSRLRDNQRLNYELIRRVVSSRVEPLLEQAATSA
jgi:hypothetical protein